MEQFDGDSASKAIIDADQPDQPESDGIVVSLSQGCMDIIPETPFSQMGIGIGDLIDKERGEVNLYVDPVGTMDSMVSTGDPSRQPVNRTLASCGTCLLYTSPSPRDKRQSRMPSSA